MKPVEKSGSFPITLSPQQIRSLKDMFDILKPVQTIKNYQFPFDLKAGYCSDKINLDPACLLLLREKLVKSITLLFKDKTFSGDSFVVVVVSFSDGEKMLYTPDFFFQIFSRKMLELLSNLMRRQFNYSSAARLNPDKDVPEFMQKHLDREIQEFKSNYNKLQKLACSSDQYKEIAEETNDVINLLEQLKRTVSNSQNGMKYLLEEFKQFHAAAIVEGNITRFVLSFRKEQPFVQNFAFFQLGDRPDLDWSSCHVEAIYRLDKLGSEVGDFYKLAHQQINQLVNKYQLPITQLVSLGCGDGNEVSGFAKSDKKLPVLLVDVNATNISDAHDRLEEKFLVKTLQADICDKQTQNAINEFVEQQQCGNQSSTLFIASGLFSHGVLQGSDQSVQVLQAIYQKANYIAIASWAATRVHNRLLKAMGYKIKDFQVPVLNDTLRQPVLLIEKQTEQERLTFIVQQSNKRYKRFINIDLTMSAMPLDDLQRMQKSSNQGHKAIYIACQQIDLSWSNLNDHDIGRLVSKHLSKMPYLQQIVISGNEAWANTLARHFATDNKNNNNSAQSTVKIYRRHDNAGHQDTVSLFSRKMLSAIKEQAKSKTAEELLKFEPFSPKL